ncbi:hypothetical protein FOZ60_009223 [Perkinsus olseni]|uniref:1,3-beta-glucanosyltransferase n=1 Tax=Perkinsus olseni TaxID=32597 RepID=A0A7J6NHY8_PEROL|nr:hypothetical protein FOZ60_009223 [Perkinsus olseni]
MEGVFDRPGRRETSVVLESKPLVASMEEVNFRVAGRLHGGRLCLGSVHDPYDSDTGKGPRSSIPARLQTVLSRGLREPIGFGRESSRFEPPRVADGPGPGAYIDAVKRRPFGHDRLTSDSWSKRGTGSFASKSTRFQRWPYPAVVPGPGTYRVSVSADQAVHSGSTATLSCCVCSLLVRLPVSWRQELYDYLLLVPIEADRQGLNLLVDTGTHELFFISKEWLEESEGLGACEASVYGCYQCTTALCDAEVSEIEFCDGDCVSIVPLTGNLTIGGQEVPGVKFGLVGGHSGSLGPHASLGLAPQPEEDEDDYIPLLDQLVMKRIIESTDFSIVFNPGNLSEGELILGGLDPSRYRGPMSFVPLKDGYNTWTVGLKSIQVVGNATLAPLTPNTPVIIDSGTTCFHLPASAYDVMMATIKSTLEAAGRHVEMREGSMAPPALRNCADREYLPPLQVAFTSQDGSDVTVVIPQEVYVQAYDTDAGQLCALLLRESSQGEEDISIGQNLLRRYYLYFQYDQKRIGFAESTEVLTKPKERSEVPLKGRTVLRPVFELSI